MKFIKILIPAILLICCLYFVESKYFAARGVITSYDENMIKINGQIKEKQDEINKANETLELVTNQNAKKMQLYESIEKWNNDILTYINQ